MRKQAPAASGGGNEEHNIDEAYDYKQGPLSKQQIKSRIETVGPNDYRVAAKLVLRYAGLSQRGYYPESKSFRPQAYKCISSLGCV